MNTTRCSLALLVVTASLVGCEGATFHPADRIDADGDGFFAVEDPEGVLTDRLYLLALVAADPEFDIAAAGLDCDDENDNSFPGAAEQCDGEDNDCDGDLADFEADQDHDGYSVCAWEHDFDDEKKDCNDDPRTFELLVDPEDPEGPTTTHYFGELQHPGRTEVCGYHPDMIEVPLGIYSEARAGRLLDDDCDGNLLEFEEDLDLDGFTKCRLIEDIRIQYEAPATVLDVDEPFDPDNPQNGLQGDCIDGDVDVFPGNDDLTCLDDGDYNSACGENDLDALATIYFRDLDGDGDGDASTVSSDPDGLPDVAYRTCTGGAPPGRWVEQPPAAPDEERRVVATDCDDLNPNVDGKDADGDGFATCPNADGDRDCDDASAVTFPDAPEWCDAEDNDCDGAVDEDYDNDGDGSFKVGAEDIDLPSEDCSLRAPGYVEDCADDDPDRDELDSDGDDETTCDSPGDCNDHDPAQQAEDFDEDGFNTCTANFSLFDCDDTDASLNPADDDGDGFGECPNELGLTDCDDDNILVYPGNTAAQCDGVEDSDCDGSPDPLDFDNDEDGVSECQGDCDDQDTLLNIADVDGDGYSTCAGDCDDGIQLPDETVVDPGDPTVFPGAPEVCDDGVLDNDCNGTADANEADADGDTQTVCAGDCDDLDPSLTTLDVDGDGSTTCDGDCDDTIATGGSITHLTDADNDGWTACGSPGASAPVSQAVPADCNDDDATLNWSDVDGDSRPTCLAEADPNGRADCDDYDSAMHDQDTDLDGISPCGPDGEPGTADDDCDDDEIAVSSIGVEIRDGLDNDCNGMADDLGDPGWIEVGDLVVVEILVGATATTGDGPAEYLEVLNNSDLDIDLRGWEVEVVNTTTAAVASWVFPPEIGAGEELVIAPGARAVIARSASGALYGTDIADFYWAGPAFSDAGGSVALIFEGREIDLLTWFGTDCISNCSPGAAAPVFDGPSTWRPGHALGLKNLGDTPHLANNSQNNLCEELTEAVSGLLFGSPGLAPNASAFGDCN